MTLSEKRRRRYETFAADLVALCDRHGVRLNEEWSQAAGSAAVRVTEADPGVSQRAEVSELSGKAWLGLHADGIPVGAKPRRAGRRYAERGTGGR